MTDDVLHDRPRDGWTRDQLLPVDDIFTIPNARAMCKLLHRISITLPLCASFARGTYQTELEVLSSQKGTLDSSRCRKSSLSQSMVGGRDLQLYGYQRGAAFQETM